MIVQAYQSTHARLAWTASEDYGTIDDYEYQYETESYNFDIYKSSSISETERIEARGFKYNVSIPQSQISQKDIHAIEQAQTVEGFHIEDMNHQDYQSIGTGQFKENKINQLQSLLYASINRRDKELRGKQQSRSPR